VLDHVGIYMMIAGSYTPILLVALHRHNSARVLLMCEWVAAFCGSVFAACSDLNAPTTTLCELVIFICMGAGALLVRDLLVEEMSQQAFTLLMLGNLGYLIGVAFFILGEWKPIFHTVWHMFVVIAAALHWFTVYLFIVNTDLSSPTKILLEGLVDELNGATARPLGDLVGAAASAAASAAANATSTAFGFF
jgi:hemolysin III